MENVPPGPGEASVKSTNDSSHALPMVLALVVVAIAAVMLLGLWVFPEAGGGKRGGRNERRSG